MFLPVIACVSAQTMMPPSQANVVSGAKKQEIAVRSWQIDPRYGIADTCGVDTVITSFQDNTPVNNYSIANSWNGNLGSPLQSKIFFDRTQKTDFIFSQPYDVYAVTVPDVKFFNTKTPYANLTWRSALPKYQEEDYFRALFSMNINKYLNVGGLVNYISGRGQYKLQNARAINGGFFVSYGGKRYAFNAVFMVNDFKNFENGGIDSLQEDEQPNVSEIRLQSAVSGYKNYTYFLNHKYSLGFDKERKLENDSVVYDFVPVTSFIHTIKFEDTQKRYASNNLDTAFYENIYYSGGYTKDSTKYQSLKNTFAITLEEKFNRVLKFGLAAFVEHELIHRANYSDWLRFYNNYENNLKVGGVLSKNEGKTIRYNVSGEVALLGRIIGDFDIKGNILTSFRLFKDTVNLSAGAVFNSVTPDFFYEKYYSNNFCWKNNFDKTLNLRAKARLSLQKTGISLGFNFATIRNYIYFDHSALPAQYENQLQVMAFDLTANLKLWKFHLDNKAVYQLSSNREILPLPDFAVFSNFYFKTKIVKVLTIQLGVSCRYNTAYYAPSYKPATGQFYVQNEEKIGNYPQMNAYVNLHLKRVRFYVQLSNWNSGVFGGNYYLMPHYPMNPLTFQFGLSWSFYN
ncbi:MAG: putative porin [Prevotellaceae bacterium]|nr:putative porin [Prevotellaceae bacterium]